VKRKEHEKEDMGKIGRKRKGKRNGERKGEGKGD